MKKPIKQKELGEAVGITQQHMSLIINAKARPSWKVAKKLATVTVSTPYLWLEGSSEDIKSHLMQTPEFLKHTGASLDGQ